MGETSAHIQLKRLAAATLLRWGCQAAAVEVLCPISRYRVDAAGYLDAQPLGADFNHLAAWVRIQRELAFEPAAPEAHPRKRERCEPRTVVIECKQSREDFLRDRENLGLLLTRREKAEERRRHFEQRVMDAEPDLRDSDGMLFSELGEWNLAAARHPTYRRILAELDRLDRLIHGGTKFAKVARYRLADRLYILAPSGVVRRREVPPGWGLIECGAAWATMRRAAMLELSEVPIEIAVEAPRHTARPDRRARLLRNIAVALTRSHARQGVKKASPGQSASG